MKRIFFLLFFLNVAVHAGMTQNISIDIPAINMPKKNPDKKMAKPKPESAAREIQNSMVTVQGGTFNMGCMTQHEDFCSENEKPAHAVTLGDFQIGKYEVTQEQWYAIMDTNPSIFSNCAKCPVENVSYEDVMAFIKKLNELTGKKFSLPTEAEWEYAARGGNKSMGYQYSGADEIETVAWYDENSRKSPTQVGKAKSNELGLFDMSGNMWEWCSDWFSHHYYSKSESKNPKGPDSGEYRVIRGGSWDSNAVDCRVTTRRDLKPDTRNAVTGFRLVLRN